MQLPLPRPRPDEDRRVRESPHFGRYLIVSGFEGRPSPIFAGRWSHDAWRKAGCPDLNPEGDPS